MKKFLNNYRNSLCLGGRFYPFLRCLQNLKKMIAKIRKINRPDFSKVRL